MEESLAPEFASIASIWSSFSAELDSRNRRLRAEIEGAWNDLNSLLERQIQNYQQQGGRGLLQGGLSSITDLVKEVRPALLCDPIAFLRKARLLQRTLSAIEDHEAGREDLLRLLPRTLAVSGKELTSLLPARGKVVRRTLLGWRRKPRPLQLRAVVRESLLRESLRRARIDGVYLLAAARAILALLHPWHSIRSQTMQGIGAGQPSERDVSAEREEGLQLISGLRSKATANLTAYGAWEENFSARLAGAALAGRSQSSDQRNDCGGHAHVSSRAFSDGRRHTPDISQFGKAAGASRRDGAHLYPQDRRI